LAQERNKGEERAAELARIDKEEANTKRQAMRQEQRRQEAKLTTANERLEDKVSSLERGLKAAETKSDKLHAEVDLVRSDAAATDRKLRKEIASHASRERAVRISERQLDDMKTVQREGEQQHKKELASLEEQHQMELQKLQLQISQMQQHPSTLAATQPAEWFHQPQGPPRQELEHQAHLNSTTTSRIMRELDNVMGNCMDNLGYDAAAAAAPPLSRQESRAAEQQMRRYDNNDDGVLQQDEFMQMVAESMPETRAGQHRRTADWSDQIADDRGSSLGDTFGDTFGDSSRGSHAFTKPLRTLSRTTQPLKTALGGRVDSSSNKPIRNLSGTRAQAVRELSGWTQSL